MSATLEQLKVWTLEELMKLFHVCDKVVKKWIKLGRLTRVPNCRKILVTDESVRTFLGEMKAR